MPHIPPDRRAGRFKRILANALGVFTAIMLIGMVQDVDAAGVVIVATFALGTWLLHRSAARDVELASQAALAQMQLPVLDLAQEDGRLTATEVATRLGWTLQQASAVLASLEDGMRVCSMPNDDGVMVYEFRELLHDPDGRRVLAAADPPPLPTPQSMPRGGV